MPQWFEHKEQSAGKIRLQILWYIYRFFGKEFLKFILYVVAFFIWIFAKSARKASSNYKKILQAYQKENGLKKSSFSSYAHILSYAHSLVDKLDVGKNSKLQFVFDESPDSKFFMQYMKQNTGVFLICSHLGNIESLPAFEYQTTENKKNLHAFMQISQNAIFHQFLQQHTQMDFVQFHPTENIDLSVAFDMQENLNNGDLVMMAADRVSAGSGKKNVFAKLLNQKCLFPSGVFKFAKALDAPVFFIACMQEKRNLYKIYLKQATYPCNCDEYAKFLQALILKYPKQWYNFYDFFQFGLKDV